jgi:hypothetical protein
VGLEELGDARPFDVREDPVGLDAEMASVLGRIESASPRRLREAGRRRARLVRTLERAGRWVEEEEVRAELRGAIPFPGTVDYPVEDPPSADDGLELLPLYFDGRSGPVALAGGLGGWEALELRSSGGVARHLGAIPPPSVPPRIAREGEALLRGYLAYFLERDLLFASVVPRMVEAEEGSVTEWIEEELRRIGATVVSRALVRAKVSGGGINPLTSAEIADGIRATDQDLMDVPTWGDRL